MSRPLCASIATALVSVALLVTPALASSPVGTYECRLGGTIELKDNGKYDFNGEKGKWKEKDDKIVFKTGNLESVYGVIKKKVLKIYDKHTDEEFDKCPRK